MFPFKQHRTRHDVYAAIRFSPLSTEVFQFVPVANVQVMVLRTHIRKQKRLLLRNCIPSIIGRWTKVSAVVTTPYIVKIHGSRHRHIRIFMKLNARPLVLSLGMSPRKLPRHPIGYAQIAVIRCRVSHSFQYLFRPVGQFSWHFQPISSLILRFPLAIFCIYAVLVIRINLPAFLFLIDTHIAQLLATFRWL